MTISANYPSPVYVNGYACKNCTDVDYAKKDIDPAHPKSGPFGINAKTDPTVNQDPAVKFGGSLSGLATSPGAAAAQSSSGVGGRVDLSI